MSKAQLDDHEATLAAIYAGRPYSVLPRESIGNFIRWVGRLQ